MIAHGPILMLTLTAAEIASLQNSDLHDAETRFEAIKDRVLRAARCNENELVRARRFLGCIEDILVAKHEARRADLTGVQSVHEA